MCRATAAGALPWAATTAWVTHWAAVRPLGTAERLGQPGRRHRDRRPRQCAGVRCRFQCAARHPGVQRIPAARRGQRPRHPAGLGHPPGQSTWPTACGLTAGLRAASRCCNGNTAKATAAIALGLDWTADPLWKGSTRLECGAAADLADTATVDERFTTTLWTAGDGRPQARPRLDPAGAQPLSCRPTTAAVATCCRTAPSWAWPGATPTTTAAMRWASWSIQAGVRRQQRRRRARCRAAPGSCPAQRRLAPVAPLVADRPRVRPSGSTDTLRSRRATARFQRPVGGGPRLVYDLTKRWDVGVAMAAVQMGQRAPGRQPLGVEARLPAAPPTCGCRPASTTAASAPTATWQAMNTPSRAPTCGCASSSTRPSGQGADPSVNRSLPR
jgi:hypothetical protein